MLAQLISDAVRRMTRDAGSAHREALVAFAPADDPRFAQLRQIVHPRHLLPDGLLPGARSVVSFFLPFSPVIVEANARHRTDVAREWALAYVETNALLADIATRLSDLLRGRGVRAVAEPPTHNFDPVTLESRWSHKSVAVIAGLGRFGLHRQVITGSGCAGRFGSLVTDAELPVDSRPVPERCLYYHDGSCLECVAACPASALSADGSLDKRACWRHLLDVAGQYRDVGLADVCGKCSTGPCALGSAV